MARKSVDNPGSAENGEGGARDSLANYLGMGGCGFQVSVEGAPQYLRGRARAVLDVAAAIARAACREAEKGSCGTELPLLITGAELLTNLGAVLHEEADHQEGH